MRFAFFSTLRTLDLVSFVLVLRLKINSSTSSSVSSASASESKKKKLCYGSSYDIGRSLQHTSKGTVQLISVRQLFRQVKKKVLFKREADIPTAVEKRNRAIITGITSESIIFAQLRQKLISLSVQKLDLQTKQIS